MLARDLRVLHDEVTTHDVPDVGLFGFDGRGDNHSSGHCEFRYSYWSPGACFHIWRHASTPETIGLTDG